MPAVHRRVTLELTIRLDSPSDTSIRDLLRSASSGPLALDPSGWVPVIARLVDAIQEHSPSIRILMAESLVAYLDLHLSAFDGLAVEGTEAPGHDGATLDYASLVHVLVELPEADQTRLVDLERAGEFHFLTEVILAIPDIMARRIILGSPSNPGDTP